MKNFTRIGFLILLSVPLFSFSQNAVDKLKELNTILKQDTSKKSKPHTQSNLAVSDEGAGGSKSKSSTRVNESPTDKLKKNQENGGAGSGAGNIAVSDEGASGPKSGTKTGISGEQPKTGDAKTPQPK